MLDADVRSFLAVVAAGSFTAAAETVGATKARVSQQVSALERRLGVTLLHRSTRQLRLTEQGASYYSECQRAQHILQQVERQVVEDSQALRGAVRLNSVGGAFAEQHLAPVLIAFMQRYPEISVSLDISSHRVDVLAESHDVVVRMGPLTDSSLVARPLYRLQESAAASPAYLKRFGRPDDPRELMDHNCLCGSVTRWEFQHRHDQRRQEVNVEGSLVVANGHVLCQAALAGLGIVRLHELYLREHLASGALLAVCEPWRMPAAQVSLVYPKVRYKLKRVELLVEYIVAHFRAVSNAQ